MKIINGLKISEEILEKLKTKIQINRFHPRLDIIQIGDNYASRVYIKNKKEKGEAIGVDVVLHEYDSISENKLIELIYNLNSDDAVNGIILQIPIPKEIDLRNILKVIDPEKDVDGLNPLNLGLVWQGQEETFVAATPLAVLECLKYIAIYNDTKFTSEELLARQVDQKLRNFLTGSKVTIINDSNIVGKPLSGLLLRYNATVTIAHKFTQDLESLTLNSDIIVSGTGIPKFIKPKMIPNNIILIDVGINETANGLSGDIDYKEIESKINWITPVPGGVGPLTVAMLLSNVVKAYERKMLR